MKKRSNKTKAVTDTTLFYDANMQQMLQATGWTINQMKLTKPKKKE